jgi:acyl-CoA synthetase (AMP-forming)/AMP-acid ligase II
MKNYSGSAPARCVHQILRHWAERTPDAIAIEAPGRAPLTYRRLFAHVEGVNDRSRVFSL